MNLPNKLTLMRVLMVPPFVLFLLGDFGVTGDIIALVLFLAASFTDYLDGHIARKYNLVTNFGKFMDPLADKLLVGSAAICLTAIGRIPAWAVVILIGREFVISGFRLIAAERGIVIAAGWLGKIKTVIQMVMTVALLIHLDMPAWHMLELILIWAATIMTLWSLVDYIVKNRHVLAEQE
ncbi:MAG: CDP-diacylglycerol--glycerol-3-phosphate 3-phosphatidyltransferase [Lachnospiraceae bacterium]|nr:CDP-diacylglycerol--glycerol-3-phosphate 3-phosphatidyltransferase [Lachnospiraceae bacterium]